MVAREFLVFAFFVGATLVFTWPLARNFSTAVTDIGDPFVSIAILDWTYYATLHRPLELFHQPILHPARCALAFTEHLIGISLFAFPLYALGLTSIAVYNSMLVLGFAFCGYGAYVLGRVVTGSTAAAMAGGIFFAFVPYRITQIPHISYVWAGWVPLLLAALFVYDRRPDWRRATLFGLAFFFNGLTCLHWFAMGGLAAALSAALLWAVRRHSLIWAGRLVIATAAATIALLPFLLPYQKVGELYGMVRSPADARTFSALPGDWLVSGDHLHYAWWLNDRSVNPERWLFPGFIPLILVVVALVLWRANGPDAKPGWRFELWFWVALLWMVLGFIGSLGLNGFLHTFLFEYVRPFQSIRVPPRWAMITYCGMSILIACGVTALIARFKAPRFVPAAMCVLLLIEFHPGPFRWYLAAVEPPPVYQWLRAAPARGAVLELPMAVFLNEYEYLYRADEHRRPLINGVSSFMPASYTRIATMANASPVHPRLLGELERIGCTFVVVHADKLGSADASTRTWLSQHLRRGELSFVRRFPHHQRGDYLFALNRVVPQAAFLREPEVPDRSGATPSEHLERFLDSNAFTYYETAIAFVDTPPTHATVRDRLTVSGWAAAPDGIRGVDLWFRNASVRIPAELFARPELTPELIGYPAGSATGFRASFPARPEWARDDADLIIELIDAAGQRHRFEPLFFTWRRRDDIRPEDWKPRAQDAVLIRLGEERLPERPISTARLIRLVAEQGRADSNPQFIQRCFRVLLNRPAAQHELAFHLPTHGRASRPQFVKYFLRSEEFQRLNLKE